MSRSLLIPIIVMSPVLSLYSNDHLYPKNDFYNRTIELPIDYSDPNEGTFFLYYQLTSNFDFDKPTLIFFQDGQQEFGTPGTVDDLAKRYHFFDEFNVVRYQHRGREYSFIELKNPDGSVNWERAYRVLSANQVIQDIEQIRKDLFKNDPKTKILLYGRSGGGCLIQRYLAKYSEFVHRAFIRAAPNPIIMKQLSYPASQYLYDTLNEIDKTLYAKLLEVLEKNIVPEYQFLWMLKAIPYASSNPGEELKTLINELHAGDKALYEEYLQKKGFDFSKRLVSENEMNALEIGGSLRVVEVGAEYMLDGEPIYIDPFYGSLKKLAEPYLKLIIENKVDAPTFPPLEKFNDVDSEVFYLAGRHDHASNYQIGVELGKYFKYYDLFIANDNHTMSIHKECYPALRNAFLKYGIGSKELRTVRQSENCKEWNSR